MKKLNKSNKVMFIAVEGGEGSGKSSLLRALGEVMSGSIMTTREPGGSAYAEIIRTAALKNPLAKTAPPETTLCLMFASRYDNVVNMIVPSIKKRVSVVTDRFDGSSYAYQVAAQTNGRLDKIFWALREKLSLVPDVYIFIDVDPKIGIDRARSRNTVSASLGQYDHFDDREILFHKKVRAGYMKFLNKVPHIIIDANRPFEIVKEDFLREVFKLLKFCG